MDSVRGELGQGAVRKWYHLEPPNMGNGTARESDDIDVA